MKKMLFLLFLLFQFPDSILAQTKSDIEIPPVITGELNRRFPGWRFPKIHDDIHKFLKEYISEDTRPEFIEGDFDGNRQLDYAVLIEYGNIYNADNQPIGHNIYIVAFLRKGNDFQFHTVDSGTGSDYLTLMKKGGKDYDFESEKNFTYKNDAIFAGIFEKAGISYVYDRGKFRAILTSD